jgi:hypothetical protein
MPVRLLAKDLDLVAAPMPIRWLTCGGKSRERESRLAPFCAGAIRTCANFQISSSDMPDNAAHTSWPDWITAGATAVTALFVALAWRAAVMASKQAERRQLPLAEIDISGPIRDPQFGDFLQADFFIKNRLDETIVITKISAQTPRHTRVSLGTAKQGIYGGELSPDIGETSFVLPDITVCESGSSSNSFGATDRARFKLYVVPPDG